MRQNDVGRACTGGFQASLDILSGLLDLRPHIALADNLALTVKRRLFANDQFTFAIARRDDDCRRASRARRPHDYRLGLVFD